VEGKNAKRDVNLDVHSRGEQKVGKEISKAIWGGKGEEGKGNHDEKKNLKRKG